MTRSLTTAVRRVVRRRSTLRAWYRRAATRFAAARRGWLRTRNVVIAVALGSTAVVALILGSVARLDSLSAGYRYDGVDEVPDRTVAVVFGNKVHADGTPGTVLTRRLETALRLYRSGKVRAILVTGDGGQAGIPGGYNEVDPMRQWLIDRGVPEGRVVGDYAGFDSYDSCVRAVKIFGVQSAVLVTQAFHLPRTVALCREVGMDAVGVAAGVRDLSTISLRRRELREDLASVKAVGDLLLRSDPEHLGRPESGIEDAVSGG